MVRWDGHEITHKKSYFILDRQEKTVKLFRLYKYFLSQLK